MQTEGDSTAGVKPAPGFRHLARHRTTVPFLVLAVLLAVLFLAGCLDRIEYPLMDLRFLMSQRPAAIDLTLVAVDPASLQSLDVWPWPRGYHATVLENLSEAGARRVAFDIDFSSLSDPEEDREFASALEAAGGDVILPTFRRRERGASGRGSVRITMPIPEFRRSSVPASIDVRPADDGRVRIYHLAAPTPAGSHSSFAATLAGAERTEPPEFIIDFAVRPDSIPTLSYRDVLTGRFDPALVRDRVVIIGATAVELGDHIAVPLNAAMPGPLLQAIAFENVSGGRLLRPVGAPVTVTVLLLLSLVVGPVMTRAGWRLGLVATAGFLVSIFLVSLALQVHGTLVLNVAPWLLLVVGGYTLSLVLEIDSQNVRFLLQRSRLRRSENLMNKVVESSFDAILTVGADGTVETSNRSAGDLFAYPPAALEGRPLHELIVPESGGADGGGIGELLRGDPGIREASALRRDGETVSVELSVSDVNQEDRDRKVVFVRDITERKRHEEALRHQAMHDPLTGLPNRTLLQERIEGALAEAEACGHPVGFLIMDLDRFKEINDTLGHQVGDRLLEKIARRLRDSLRPPDTIARLGGDEFAILLPTSGEDGTRQAAVRLMGTLEEPFLIDGLSLRVGASAGIAMYPQHGAETFELLQKADVAMYIAKGSHGGISTYQADADYNSLRHLVLNGELQEAIENGRLVLYYQPKISLRTGRVVSAEALVRWEHPELGLLPPDEFIGLAEHSGLIRPLTQWVLDRAIGQCVAWHVEGYPLSVAVNLSARNLLEDELPLSIRRLLEKHGLPPGKLVLEITEGLIMEDPERAREIITRLDELGVRISIDDFGTGYSSLAYLKRLPTAEIKIDKSFVRDMDRDREDAVIVRSTIELAHNLDRPVVAEGVESERVRMELATLGCDYGQGYLFSPPLPVERFGEWLRNSRWSPSREAGDDTGPKAAGSGGFPAA